jgi:PAS domain S-box-containing protein
MKEKSLDITKKNTEDVPGTSEEKYRGLVQSIQDAIFIIRDGKILYANEGLAKVADYKVEELIGRDMEALIAPEDLAMVMERHARLMKGEQVSGEYDFRLVKKGKVTGVDVLVSAAVIHYEGGLAVMGVGKDITQRKQAEEKLNKTLNNLRQSIKTTIHLLNVALEARDPYTTGHQRRVSDLARAIAQEKKLSRNIVEGIRMAGSVHDIGKLTVPGEILTKPAKLTNIELFLIKEHSQAGYEMLKYVDSPWPLAEIVLQHHERMNGAGYPRNLKGDDILMAARIIGVADVVEAMSSQRPYRPSLGIEAALEEIDKNKGILYDETVVEACLRLFRTKGYRLP